MGTATARTAPPQGRAGSRRERAERNALVLRHLSFARTLARRYANRGEPLDDLEQVAVIGLMKAIERYDPARGDLLSFAAPTIVGEIRRHFRDRTWMVRPSRSTQEGSAAVARATEGLTAQLRRSPTIGEIAAQAGIREEDVLDALAARSAYRPLSLSEPAGGDDGDAPPAVAVAVSDDGYRLAEARALVAGPLAALCARDRAVVLLRFREDLTQAEIARRIGDSQMHVSRLLSAALERLRREVAPAGA